MTMANVPGWLPDPERDDQERYWNGASWTDRVRPAGMGAPLVEPGHAPDLQRALAAATADIDAVEERLSLLFERTEAGAGDANPSPSVATTAPSGRRDAGADYGDADAAFADLDAALAAEEADQPDEPDKVKGKDKGKAKDKATGKRGMFRRRAKDAPSAQS